ncbi:MAG: site-2 protease family protein [Deltaproteobacteria bacterium]|nr:site-2 protease family protein [Deltaproteobacteria bacterium]
MKWKVKLGKFAGIDVFIHFTFVLLIGWVGFLFWTRGNGLVSMIEGIIFILLLFTCVVLHEFGHALAAKRYGIKTRDIILLPIGGVARLERMPENPRQELWVALAGPAVNVVIASILFLWLQISQTFEPFQNLTLTTGSFAERLLSANVFLALFNMLPAFPMDGGRVLRALLAYRLDYSRATQYAATIGQGMAFLFGILGFFSNPFLLFIAIFIYLGAAQEASMVRMKSFMSDIFVKDAMVTDFVTLNPADPLKRAVELTLTTSQRDFPVVEDGELRGILIQPVLFDVLQRRDQEVSVDEVMVKEFASVDSLDKLETAFIKLNSCNCTTIPVLRNGQLIGLLTTENVGEFVKIQTALGKVQNKRDWGVDAA